MDETDEMDETDARREKRRRRAGGQKIRPSIEARRDEERCRATADDRKRDIGPWQTKGEARKRVGDGGRSKKASSGSRHGWQKMKAHSTPVVGTARRDERTKVRRRRRSRCRGRRSAA
jgi:hypothetical protein